MEIKIKKRSSSARITDLKKDNLKIQTPNLLFLETNRVKPPKFAEVLQKDFIPKQDYFVYPKDVAKKLSLKKTIQMKDSEFYIIPGDTKLIDQNSEINNSKIFIVYNSKQLFQQNKKFVEFITKLREKIGYEKLIYTPGICNPSNLSLLTYLGVDLFDSINCVVAARNKIFQFPTGNLLKNDIKEKFCNCPVCSKKEIKDFTFEDILNHNYQMVFSELKLVKNCIKNKDLRSLVEKRVKTDPHLTSVLKILDQNYYEFLEERTDLTSKNKLLATTQESLNRPEIKRFQKRVIKNYKKPDSAKILLLLPCSAKKPYSFSKSHKIFRGKIFNTGNPFVFHEVIITSPMGVVPRDLELVYPAASYDISVTGVWDEYEKKMIKSLLSDFLKNNDYDEIIVHLPEDLTEFLEDIIPKHTKTCEGSPTSKDSLEKLEKTLEQKTKKYGKIKAGFRSFEDVKNLAVYQFGPVAADKLIDNTIVRGKYPYFKIFEKNTQIGMITLERGLISLTLDGAKKIVDTGCFWVDIADDFDLVGSVFAPGVIDADKNIRIGDEVIILRKKKIVASGVAMMNGSEMKQLSYGEAVKVRHKI